MSDPRTLVQDRLTNHTWGLLGSQGHVLGLDIGSYGLRAALIDLHSHTYTSVHRESPGGSAEAVFGAALELAQDLLSEQHVTNDRLVRIGVGFPGPVDVRRGVALLSPRMPGWEQFPICERVEAVLGATTLVDNDANLIALAEASFGAGRDIQNLFYLHLSTGVGGGLVLNGRLYHGATATAGEIGHAVVGPIDPTGREGRPGTLEEHLSISGLLRRAAALGLETASLDDIFADGPAGRQVVAEAADLLGARLSQISALIDPNLIVLGGIVARIGGERFLKQIEERVRAYDGQMITRHVPLVASVLGVESVAIGGLALALESLEE
ncbi:MAG: ROK family protein [Roseiflexaceae bacterium]